MTGESIPGCKNTSISSLLRGEKLLTYLQFTKCATDCWCIGTGWRIGAEEANSSRKNRPDNVENSRYLPIMGKRTTGSRETVAYTVGVESEIGEAR